MIEVSNYVFSLAVIWCVIANFFCAFAKHYLFKKDLTDNDILLINYSSNWIRIVIVITLLAEIGYIIGTDIGLLNGLYYIHSLILCGITIYISAVWDIYIEYKHGPKNYQYVETLKVRLQAAIALPLIIIIMYIFY